MKSYNISGFNYHVCERCREVFFDATTCSNHENFCNGTYVPEVFRVRLSLCGERSSGLKVGVSKEQDVPPTPSDKITVTMPIPFLASSHGTTRLESSPVVIDDLPKAIAAVKTKFLEKLMDLAKNLGEVDEFVGMVADNIQKARERCTDIS